MQILLLKNTASNKKIKISLTYSKGCLFAFLFILAVGCDSGPSFTWNPEIKTMTGGDLSNWLKSAPFTGIWDPNDNTEGKVDITNTREVNPFMGTLINEDDNLTLSSKKYKPFFQEKYVIFKDKNWGESVVYGACCLILKNYS